VRACVRACLCVCVCACVHMCVRERERERVRARARLFALSSPVCMCGMRHSYMWHDSFTRHPRVAYFLLVRAEQRKRWRSRSDGNEVVPIVDVLLLLVLSCSANADETATIFRFKRACERLKFRLFLFMYV